jgi:iron complex outermembrane receptor protein
VVSVGHSSLTQQCRTLADPRRRRLDKSTPMHRFTHLLSPLFAAAMSAWLAHSLAAQETMQDTVPPVDLEPVVVTVLRVPFSLYTIPYGVSLGGDSAATRFQPRLVLGETLAALPGVDVQNRYNYAQGDRVSIRGFGARTQFGIRGIKIFVDGVSATLADGQTTLDHLDLGTVEHVETIRGPASSIYGNASGGVIRFDTRQPTDTPFRQQFGTIVGSNGLRRWESATGTRIGRISLALDLAKLSYDGYRQHSAADKLFASAHIRYSNNDDNVHVVANYTDFDALNPGSLSDSMLATDRKMANPFNVTQRTGKDARQGHIGVAWSHTTRRVNWDISAYGLFRNLLNNITVRVIELDRKAGGVRVQFSGQRDLVGLPTKWAVGTEADLQFDDRRNFANELGEKGTLARDEYQTVWSVGPFLQVDVAPARQLHILGGLRYDVVRFESQNGLCTGDDAGNTGCNSDRTMKATSPSLGMLVDVVDPLSLYANVATAFETPTTTELGNRPDGGFGYDPELEPQRAVSVELGVKGRLGWSAQYDVAIYRAHVTEVLVPFEVPDQPGRTYFRNAGSAIHRGIELGVTFHTRFGISLSAAYTYTDARYEDFTVGGVVYDGNRTPGVVPHRLELLARYDADHGWYLASEIRLASEMAVNDANSDYSPAYVLVGLRAGFRQLRVGWLILEPFLGTSNLFDVAYNSSVTVNAFGGRYYEPGPARSMWFGAKLAITAR